MKSTNKDSNNNSEEIQKYKLFLEWNAPMRLFRKHRRQDYVMVLFIALSVASFLFIIKQYVLISGVIAIVFLVFVMWSVVPGMAIHKITSLGFFSIDKLYPWDQLVGYWFSNIDGIYVLNIDTNQKFPARIVALVGKREDADKVHDVLQNKLKYQVINKQNFLSKKLDGIYIPLKENVEELSQTSLDHESLLVKNKSSTSK